MCALQTHPGGPGEDTQPNPPPYKDAIIFFKSGGKAGGESPEYRLSYLSSPWEGGAAADDPGEGRLEGQLPPQNPLLIFLLL